MDSVAQSAPSRALPLLAAQAAFLGLATSILYTAANSLFLERFGSSLLPVVYVLTAASVPPVFALLVRLQKRWPLSLFSLATITAFGALLLVARLAMDIAGTTWLAVALMIAVVLVMQANMVVLGSQASQLWDVQEMKRRYPLVMAGQILGVILGGAVAAPLGRLLGGTRELLFVSAAAMCAGAATGLTVAGSLRRAAGARSAERRFTPTGRRATLLGSPYVSRLLAFRILVELGSNLVNYLFLRQVDAHFRDPQALTSFFGSFMAAATLLTLLFLLTAAGRILMRFGIGVGLAGNPVAVGATLGLAILVAALGGAGASAFFVLILAARLINFVIVTGLTDPALKAAYQPLPPHQRATVQTVVEGMGVPLAVGLAGGVLLGIGAIPGIRLEHIVLFTLAVMASVVILAVICFRAYRGALEKTLTGPRVPLDRISLEDGSSLEAVLNLLDGSAPGGVRLALDLLEQAGHPAARDRLAGLLEHPDAGVRRDALARIERHRVVGAVPSVRRAVESDTDVTVRASALRALCALDPEAESLAARYVEDPDQELRMGAVTGLLRSSGIDGALSMAPWLRRLLDSPDPADRCFVARLVGEVEAPDFAAPLLPLLRDSDPAIRRAALRSAGRVGSPRLLDAVVALLEDLAVRSDAMAALAGFGEKLLPAVSRALGEAPAYRRDVARRLVRACGQIRGAGVTGLLTKHLGHPDPELRLEIARALSLCGYHAAPEGREELRRGVRWEIARGQALRVAGLATAEGDGDGSLAAALEDELRTACRRVCFLLGFLYDTPSIAAAQERLRTGDAKERSLARELLEVTLDRELKSSVLELVMDAAPAPSRGGARGRARAPEPALADPLRSILESPAEWPYPWVRTCAIYSAARHARTDLAPLVREALGADEPWCRRTAAWALGVLTGERPAPPGQNGEDEMVDVERVILLKASPIFAETPDRALAALADLADRVDVAEGETVIRKGEPGSCMYVVARGRFRVHDGDRAIAVLESGEIIGEMALLDPAPRAASVTALEQSVLFRLDKDAFDVAMADNPEIVHGVLQVLCRRLRTQIQRQPDG